MVDDDVVAVGEKILLRKKRIEDAEDDHGWRQDPELAELDAASVLRQSLKDFRRDLEHELKTPTPWVKRFGVDTLDGLHIGNCMVYDIDTVTGQGELGILLGNRDYWNGGYGREAMKLLGPRVLRAAFDEASVPAHTLLERASPPRFRRLRSARDGP